MLRHLPQKHPQPDARRFIDILMGREKSSRVPLVEYIVDDVVMRPIVTDLLGRQWVPEAADRESQKAYLDNFIAFWQQLGYDFVRFERALAFPMKQTIVPDPVAGSDKQRAWADEHEGSIRNWDDFERYPWPTVEQMDFFPKDLRALILPWHRRFAAIAHAKGLPYFLHSCGNILKIMDDLINEVGIDGKHSYEDVIIPAPEFQARYGDRLAVLGGLDVNILAASTPQQVRKHARFLLETCGGRGRYALGSGNSIPSYVPPENYLAMLDEAFEVQVAV
jgi:hypothetical protein